VTIRAAANRHVSAIFGRGHGLPADGAVARNWLRKTAELGHRYVQMALARHLSDGVAVGDPPDHAQRMISSNSRFKVDVTE
jgi:TPR repeat protein